MATNASLGASPGIGAISAGLVGTELTLTACIVLFGLGGNSLTICVLRAPHMRQSSTAFYFTVLAGVDILVLLVGPTLKTLSAAVYGSERHLRDTSDAACKAQLFLNYSATQVSAWLLVAVTIDRAVCVLLPFRARQYCTIRRAACSVLLIVLLICSVNLCHLWHSVVLPDANSNRSVCYINHTFTRQALVYMDPALVTVGPFLVMLAANLLILRKLQEVRRRRRTSLNKLAGQRQSGSNLTRMLLGANIFYLASSLPYLALMLVLQEKRKEILARPLLTQIVYCVQVCCYTLFNLNYAIHFLLYCLTGPAFKAEACRLLRLCKPATAAGHRSAGQTPADEEAVQMLDRQSTATGTATGTATATATATAVIGD